MRTTARRQRPRPRQARSERTRQQILEAALQLLAEGGPGAVTHRAVAEAAGASLGATTYYFRSKRELLGEVLRLHLSSVRTRSGSLLEAFPHVDETSHAAPRESLVEGIAAYIEAGARSDRAATLANFELLLECARDPALRRRLRGPRAESMAYAVEALGSVGIRDPELDSALLIAVINGLKLEWLAAGERSAFAERVPHLVRRLTELFFSDGSADRADPTRG